MGALIGKWYKKKPSVGPKILIHGPGRWFNGQNLKAKEDFGCTLTWLDLLQLRLHHVSFRGVVAYFHKYITRLEEGYHKQRLLYKRAGDPFFVTIGWHRYGRSS